MKSLYLLYVTFFCFTPYCMSINDDSVYDEIIPYSGSISPRILGGTVSGPNSHRHFAYIEIHDSDGKLFICTGSVISHIHVLTAAHCLRGRIRAKVILGAHDVSIMEPTQKDFNVSEDYFIVHPSIDIAIIKLPTPGYDGIDAMLLPVGEAARRDYSFEIATAYGWGLIEVNPRLMTPALHEVNLLVLPPYLCNLEQGEICAYNGNGKGTCFGDSGGPLMVDGLLIGVTSRGNVSYEVAHYVSVSALLPWIMQQTNIRYKNIGGRIYVSAW